MSIQTNCRFVCESVTDFGNNHQQVNMRAIWTGHPDDNNYSQATPSGNITLTVTNPYLVGNYKPGKTYNVVITEYEEPETE